MLPCEKYLQYGAEGMSDEELLAIIIRTGTEGKDALTLACHVLDLCGRDKGLLGLFHLTVRQLCQIEGIGKVKAVKLKAVAELSRRMAGARIAKDVCLNSPAAVADAYMERMRHLEQEVCITVYLDSADHRIEDRVLSKGSMNATVICAKEIFRQALLLNAASVILLHNHPSGNPAPSEDDIKTTKKLILAAEFMDVQLLDHIIIGDGRYYSLRKEGML
ncbi:MAG: DNA repair protein RadC [Lachnospiraceae bacterium]|nr:DNA repair protein RadC [Lachnospiraceae bacterium]